MESVWAGSFALGVTLSRLLDPVRGRRRRALIRDKALSAAHMARDAADTTARDDVRGREVDREGLGWEDTTAREVAAALRGQPGFRSYTLVRTPEWEVVAVTVFDSRQELEAAMGAVAPLVRATVRSLVADEPDRREGVVVIHAAA